MNHHYRSIVLLTLVIISHTSTADEQTLITIADAKTSPASYVDIGQTGNSLGDQYIFDQPLLDHKKNKIGNNSGFCTRTKLNHSQQCQWTLTLKDGTIQVAGREFDKGESSIAIVGGTGHYRNISGEMTSFNNEGGTFTQTMKFTLP